MDGTPEPDISILRLLETNRLERVERDAAVPATWPLRDPATWFLPALRTVPATHDEEVYENVDRPKGIENSESSNSFKARKQT